LKFTLSVFKRERGREPLSVSGFASALFIAVMSRFELRVTRSNKRANETRSILSGARVLNELKSRPCLMTAAIGTLFKDGTYLGFGLDPFLWITPDFSDWKTHNYKPLKRWPPLRSE
jgi:hypothetical protein